MIFRRRTTRAAAVSSPALTMNGAKIAPEEPAGAKKILLVDDDPVILGALSLKLKAQGYRVVTASDGSQAINAARQERPDLMLLDVCFPPDVAHGGGVPWNGFLILDWLHRLEETRKLPVIVMTGADKVEYKKRASEVGATAFFQKPIDNQELLTAIDTALLRKDDVSATKAARAS